MNKKIEFYRHHLGKTEKDACLATIDSLFLTTGPACAKFEKKFANFLNVGQVITMASCTIALELTLRALGIKPGDEIITSPLTFIATINAILHTGAKPIFVDVEPTTGNIDPLLVEAAITPHTKAILPIHLYGAMCDIRTLKTIADFYKLWLIADCAHAIEATRDGLTSAELVDAACYSFYATKNLTCGEGGAVACNSKKLAERLRILRLHGMSKGASERYHNHYHHWDVVELGFKANLSDINASLLLSQLPGLLTRLTRREKIANIYETRLASLPEVVLPSYSINQKKRHARHLFTIWVNQRDCFLKKMKKKNIGVAVHYKPVHLFKYYQDYLGYKIGDFVNAEYIGNRTISLPLYSELNDKEIEKVIAAVTEIAYKLKKIQ